MYLTSFRSLWKSQTFLENSNSTCENSDRKHYELRKPTGKYLEFIRNISHLALYNVLQKTQTSGSIVVEPRNWRHFFAITRFRYIEVLFHIVYTITGVRKIVRSTEEFYINKFVISRFHSR